MTEDKKIFTTPKVRRFARELGANVSLIKGTERKGRITQEDVKKFISNQLKEPKNIIAKVIVNTNLSFAVILCSSLITKWYFNTYYFKPFFF